MFATQKEGRFVSAALNYAIHDVKGICFTERAINNMHADIQFDELVSYRIVIHGLGEKLQLPKVKKGSVSPFEWLMK